MKVDKKKVDVSKNQKKKRAVKSASKAKIDNQDNPKRKIVSANAAKGPVRKKAENKESVCTDEEEEEEEEENWKRNDADEIPKRPAILKYQREKTIEESEIPKINSRHSNERHHEFQDDDLPPTHGLFNGPCQFCGKPILTTPFGEEIIDNDFPLDQVMFCFYILTY